MHENNTYIKIQRSCETRHDSTYHNQCHLEIRKCCWNSSRESWQHIETIERFTFMHHHRLCHRQMPFVMNLCSLIPDSFHKPECIQCCASCKCITGSCSQSGSCTWLLAADCQEQGLVLSAVAQIPHHGLWMDVSCTWCDLLTEPLMSEGVQGVSRSAIVDDHKCSLSCTCHIVRWSWTWMQYHRLLTERVVRLIFLEGSSLSNPMEPRCCVAPNDCMHEDDVLTHVRPKPLLHSLDVPCARLFCVLLWFRAKEEVVWF